MRRVEKIEAGNETPVEEPEGEDQKKDEGDQYVEAGDVVSIVVETQLHQEDSDVHKLTQVRWSFPIIFPHLFIPSTISLKSLTYCTYIKYPFGHWSTQN